MHLFYIWIFVVSEVMSFPTLFNFKYSAPYKNLQQIRVKELLNT